MRSSIHGPWLLPFLFAASLPAQAPATPAPAAVERPAPAKVAFLRPSGSYVDLPSTDFSPLSLLAGGGAGQKPFFKLLEALGALAKADGASVLLDLSGEFRLNLPQLREVERALGRVRQAGKRVIAYLENADAVALQVASQCDRVLMADMAAADFRSPALTVTHFKDALDLLGVQAEMTRVGEFKGAVEPYVLSEMSPALKRHYEAMLAAMNDDVVRRVAEGRRISRDKVRELQATRLLRAEDAKAAGLVDALVPWEGGRRAMLAELALDDVELVDAMPKKKQRRGDLFAMLSEMFRSKREDDGSDGDELIVLHLTGAISDGDSGAAGGMVSGPTVKTIDELAGNEHVKGVVVRINSPGGSATASEAIRRALERLAAKKPVVISMGELAASGGYWITCIGRPIVAEAGTITGSIGVFSLRLNGAALMRRLGVRMETVALDDGARMDAIDRPWSDAARERMQVFVDGIYDRFVGLVAASRRLEPEAVRKLAGGRVWSGGQALDLKLVDALGGLDDALAMVRQQGKVDAAVEVRHVPSPRDFASTLMESLFDARTMVGTDSGLRQLLLGMGRLDGLEQLLRAALLPPSPTTVWALLPADLRIR